MDTALVEELYRLRGKDPEQALSKLDLLGKSKGENIVKAIVLIDCGDALARWNTVNEGVELLQSLFSSDTPNPEDMYNLANGLQVRARHSYGPVSPVFGRAPEDRFQARVLFGQVMKQQETTTETKSQMATNIGILLLETHRWVEALDWFRHAQRELPRNGVAAFQEMRRLMKLAALFGQDRKTYHSYCDLDALLQRVRTLSGIVENNYNTISEFAGSAALEIVVPTVQDAKKIEVFPEPTLENPYYKFVQENDLTLRVCCSVDAYEDRQIDCLNIPSVQTALGAGHEVPEIYAMMNVMKADFAFARQLFFDVQECVEDTFLFETTTHSDTLDYALYGVRYSALTTAQRVAFDILDKIAVAMGCYFSIEKADKTSFSRVWGTTGKGGVFKFRTKIETELGRGNQGLIALYNIHQDISKDEGRGAGFMKVFKQCRDTSTHKFSVLHDMGVRSGFSSSSAVEHQRVDEFERLTLDSIKLARAALFYFVDAVVFSEKNNTRDDEAFVLESQVPDHRQIRGHDH